MNAVIDVRPDVNRFLAVGDHVIDTDTLRLLSRADGVRLTPKAAAVLLHLVRARGRTLSREELLNEVWKGTCPTPDVLTQAVKDLRRALGDDLHAPRYVETLPRLGYRLVAEARFVDGNQHATTPFIVAAAVDVAEPFVASGAKPPARRAWGIVAAGLLLALLAAVAFTWRTQTPDAMATPAFQWQVTGERSITADHGAERVPHISPDGTRVAYTVGGTELRNSRIVQRALDSPRLIGLSDATRAEETYPAWSPDGTMIAYMRHAGERCEVMVEPILGGPARLVGPCHGGQLSYFSWAPDSRYLLMSKPLQAQATARSIVLVAVDGGNARPIEYERAQGDIDLEPRYSPDGRSIAFRRGANPYSDLYVMDARGGSVRPLTHLASRINGFGWTRDGSALVFSSGHTGQQALYTVSLDRGQVVALGVQPAEFPSTTLASDTIVYEIPRMRTQLAMIALGQTGEPVRDLVASTGSDGAPVLSPADARLAFVSDRGGAQQVWLHDPAIDETFALTDAGEPNLRYPVWRSDGARLLVTARGEGWGYLIEIDIATRRRTVLTSEQDDVRYGVYGTAPGRYAAIFNDARQKRELVEFQSRGGRAVSKRVLASDVGRIEYDHVGAALYFTRINQPGLFRLDARSGVETLATSRIDPMHLDGWLVSDGRIYYIASHANGHGDICMFDPATGVDSKVVSIPGTVADLNFSLSRDGSHAVVVRSAQLDNDIGAIELKRMDTQDTRARAIH